MTPHHVNRWNPETRQWVTHCGACNLVVLAICRDEMAANNKLAEDRQLAAVRAHLPTCGASR